MKNYFNLQSAANFVREKFDATPEEIDCWIFHNINKLKWYDIVQCDKKRENCMIVSYYKRSTIENFDFTKSPYPRVQRISRSEIDGNIISGLEAAAILRKKYSHCYEWTITFLLDSIIAFITNKPNKNAMLVVNSNINDSHTNLFYSKKEVDGLVPSSEQQFISATDLMRRDTWKKFSSSDIITRLETLNRERRLKAFDPIHITPGYTRNNFIGREANGGEITLTERIPVGHYAEEARILIAEKKALFQLSEIIEIEESFFPKPEQSDPPKSDVLDREKELFGLVFEALKDEGKVPTKKKVAEMMLTKGLELGIYQQRKKPAIATIERKLSELAKSDNIPSYGEVKIQLKNVKGHIQV
jgi:hypothetical protein